MSITHYYVKPKDSWRLQRIARKMYTQWDYQEDICAIVTDKRGRVPYLVNGRGEWDNGTYKLYDKPMTDRVYLSDGTRGVALYCSHEYFKDFVKLYNGELIMINEYPFKFIVRKVG